MGMEDQPALTADDERKVEQLLQRLEPIEYELAGHKSVRHIIQGGTFSEIAGGRHFDMSEGIALLASLATLCQVSVAAIRWYKSRSAPVAPSKDDIAGLVRTIIKHNETLAKEVANQMNRIPEIVEGLSDDLE